MYAVEYRTTHLDPKERSSSRSHYTLDLEKNDSSDVEILLTIQAWSCPNQHLHYPQWCAELFQVSNWTSYLIEYLPFQSDIM
jgi:hypothetical protein